MKFSSVFATALLGSVAAAAPVTPQTSDKIPVPFPQEAVNQIVPIGVENMPIFLNNSGHLTLFLLNTSVTGEPLAEKRELAMSEDYNFDAAEYMKREDFPISDLTSEPGFVKREAKKKSRWLTYWFFQPILKREENEGMESLEARDAKKIKKSRWLTYWFFQPILKREENEGMESLEARDAKKIKKSRWLTYWFFQPILKREENEGMESLEARDAKKIKKSRWLTYWFFQPIL